MAIRVFLRDGPQRAIALATDSHVLIFRHSPTTTGQQTKFSSSTSLNESGTPRCIVEFSPWGEQDMNGFRTLSSLTTQGTLGLVTINGDVFLCVVTASSKVAEVRPGERINKINGVDFHCLTSSRYDHLLQDHVNPFPTDHLDSDVYDRAGYQESLLDHPCSKLKKLLSEGTFYYSADFDLTKRVQDRPAETTTVSIDSLDGGFLWNTYMIQPLVDFRSRLSGREKAALDQSRILTSAIRGYAYSIAVPASSSPARNQDIGLPSNMTLISRLSCRRAGTRFNSRGIDDDGNVANFSETETIFTTDQLCFSYVQCRGSVPLFWEQASGLPGQQKIQITRSVEATQPAFDKHMQRLSEIYGDIVAVNLLSEEKPQETQLTRLYMHHIDNSTLNHHEKGAESEHKHIIPVNYDFHAETRGPNGYQAASGIRRSIEKAVIAFEYYLSEDAPGVVHQNGRKHSVVAQNEVLKQAGVFRTNCLDCLDRTNLVQTIISQIAFELFLAQRGERTPTSDFWARHGMLWADNGDELSKIYAGTGALKSSFTRSGKMSLAGTLADIRKSAQRLYINNIEDPRKQTIMDMLLGRLVGQTPVHLFDPINDWVMGEMTRRSPEYTTSDKINIWAGTFNLNGKTHGLEEDLRPWLCPDGVADEFKLPEIVAVAFQEIVDLDVNQILSTDPVRRSMWETAVRETLNENAKRHGGDEYVMLRGGQLVGASLSIFVKTSALPMIRNVEGAVKKTGLSGMAGNKGAVAIRMEFADTSLCLVTAHLAAGFGNYDERNQDYRTISSGLRFQRNRSIDDHNTVIWFGDFNYRIGLSNERARTLIKTRDLGQLYENDQLNLQMVHGKVFPHYSEQTPTFMPTYKFNPGTDEYDTSDKARIPAWCDRILTKGDNIRQLYYDSANLRFSDHKPVWGVFSCTVSVVDQVKKDRISNQLYMKRRAVVGNHTAGATGADSDDESLYGYESVESGLPPASSEKRKWWLDNGMPARSTVQPPSADHVPNPARPSNPYTPSNEPDWVRVEKPGNTPPSRPASLYRSPSTRVQASSPIGAPSRGEVMPRKLPPPFKSPQNTTQQAANLASTQVDGLGDQQLKQTLRKPAPPPKPTKPNLLRSTSGTSSVTSSVKSVPPPAPEPRRANLTPSQTTRSAFSPPPPIRANDDIEKRNPAPVPPPPRKPVKTSSEKSRIGVGDGDEKPPALPVRRPTAPIMDDDGNGEAELGGWVPLKPT